LRYFGYFAKLKNIVYVETAVSDEASIAKAFEGIVRKMME